MVSRPASAYSVSPSRRNHDAFAVGRPAGFEHAVSSRSRLAEKARRRRSAAHWRRSARSRPRLDRVAARARPSTKADRPRRLDLDGAEAPSVKKAMVGGRAARDGHEIVVPVRYRRSLPVARIESRPTCRPSPSQALRPARPARAARPPRAAGWRAHQRHLARIARAVAAASTKSSSEAKSKSSPERSCTRWCTNRRRCPCWSACARARRAPDRPSRCDRLQVDAALRRHELRPCSTRPACSLGERALARLSIGVPGGGAACAGIASSERHARSASPIRCITPCPR